MPTNTYSTNRYKVDSLEIFILAIYPLCVLLSQKIDLVSLPQFILISQEYSVCHENEKTMYI